MRNRTLAMAAMVAVMAVGLTVGHFAVWAGGQEKKVQPAAHDLHGGAFEHCAKTMIYTHVLNRGGQGVKSPLDR